MSEGRIMQARTLDDDIKRASTARLATKYPLSHSGASFSSTNLPPGTSGQPASAQDTKAKGYLVLAKGRLGFFSTASMTLNMVCRVMASYVLSSPGRDPLPLTMVLNWARPELTSKSKPTAWTAASLLLMRFFTVLGSVASPAIHVTFCRLSLLGFGLIPRRLRAVTVWPRAARRSHTAEPTYPVPPKTATFLGVAAVDRAATRAPLVERTRAAAERTGRAKERMVDYY
mmetsp:Transcript_168/g.434  ORF Transcript_168/g.434 Transcript_168/m.434 type:complete len:229 (-) Transcript_168:70-756(-)